MANTTLVTPYATAMPFVVAELPGWVDEYNAQRLASYDLYDDLYANSPSTYSLMLRGSDENPIYIPTAKRLINTLARYVGRGWGFAVDPTLGSESEQLAAMAAFQALFDREEIISQFAVGKKDLLKRGDWLWYLLADPLKPQGSRISVRTVDPRTYFPITDDYDLDKVTGASIVEEFLLPDGTTVALKQQRWLKPSHPDHPDYENLAAVDIAYESRVVEMKDWQDPLKVKVVSTLVDMEVLPGITAPPIYHIRNEANTSNPFGLSLLSGVETIIAGINQAISDEDLSLAMAGLGIYVAKGTGSPVNAETKQPSGWELSPQDVLEIGGDASFERIDGITSITPFQEHVKYLESQVYGLPGINDVALGTSTGTLSGIALAIKMQPLFDTADDVDLQINGKLSQMFHDLRTWLRVYEGLNLDNVRVYSTTDSGDRLPFDREGRWAELVAGFEANIFSLEFVHRELVAKFGFDLTKKDLTDALAQAANKAAQADPYAERVNDELNADDDEDAEGDPEAE